MPESVSGSSSMQTASMSSRCSIVSPLVCPLCGEQSEPTMTKLLHHIRLFHAEEPNFRITCSLQGCQKQFKNYYTFRNHLYAFHSHHSESFTSFSSPNEPTDPYESDNNDQLDDNESDFEESDQDESNDSNSSSAVSAQSTMIQKAAATWILKVREKHLLPQSTIETIIQDIDTLYEVSSSVV